jgi:integration host factor subunit alpha
MTLTKAELADLLFEKVGLNKREAKDMVEAFLKKSETRWKPAMASSSQVSVTFNCETSRNALAAIRRPARKSQSRRDASLPFMPAKS